MLPPWQECVLEYNAEEKILILRPCLSHVETTRLTLHVAASIAFLNCHKFEPGFPCSSHSLCLLCFDVPSFSVVSRAPRPLLIDFR